MKLHFAISLCYALLFAHLWSVCRIEHRVKSTRKWRNIAKVQCAAKNYKKNATKSSIVNQSKTTLIHIVFSCTYSCCILMHIFILYSHAHTSTTDDSSECGRANHQLATTVGRQQWRRPLRKRDKQHEYSYELMQDRKDLFTCTSAQTNMAPNTLHETRKVIVFLKMIFFQLARKRKKTTCPNPCIARWSDVSMTLFWTK